MVLPVTLTVGLTSLATPLPEDDDGWVMSAYHPTVEIICIGCDDCDSFIDHESYSDDEDNHKDDDDG